VGRHRGVDDAVTFDLVPDDDAGLGSGADVLGTADDELPRPLLHDVFSAVRAFLGRQPRRRLVACAAVVAVLVVGGTGAGVVVNRARATAAEQDRVTALLASPGGVRDVSGPLSAAWTSTVLGPLLGVLPGTLVVQDGADAVGLRTGDGTEAWRRPLGGGVDCGPLPTEGERAPTPTRLVCLSGVRSARHVTVLGADGGVIAQRDLGDVTDGITVPTADGGLLTVVRTGEAPQLPHLRDDQVPRDVLPNGLLRGQGAILTVKDAATGDLRWTRPVPFHPVADVTSCASMAFSPGGDDYTVDRGSRAPQVSATVVAIKAGGVAAAVLPDGTPLSPGRRAARDAAASERTPVPDGGFVAYGSGATLLLDAAGTPRFVTTAVPVEPRATDRVDDRTLAAAAGGLQAFGPDGERLWSCDLAVLDVPVRAGGVAVALTGDADVLVGVSMADGTQRWRIDLVQVVEHAIARHARHGPWLPANIQSVVTDGRTAVLALAASRGSAAHPGSLLVGVDLRTGSTWAQVRDGDSVRLLALDGELLEYAVTGGVTLRALEGGEVRSSIEGTLSLLTPGPAPTRAVSRAADD
jgi:outer membrane protein assembly factor BamB